MALTATMCSGRQLYAYLEVSPVDAEIAAALADNTSWQYEWDLGGFQPQGVTSHVEQVDYDAETQTALVKASLMGDVLEQTEQMELKLYLKHELKQEAAYGPVVIPITQAEMLSCPADVAVPNVKTHLKLEAAGLDPADFPDYVAEGRITRLTICAGYIEVELETPSLDQWASLTGLDQVEIEAPPDASQTAEELSSKKEWFIQFRFLNSWYTSVNEALAGATLHYKNGTSQVIDEIPSIYASIWTTGGGKVEDSVFEGKDAYRFTPQKPFDLSAVKSITIGNTEYFFPTGD